MNRLRLFLLALVLVSFTSSVTGDAGIHTETTPDNSHLLKELEDLKSTKSNLELAIQEKTAALRQKEKLLEEKQVLINGNKEKMLSLEKEIASLKNKGTGDLEAETLKARAHVADLQKQVEKLEKSLKEKQQKEISLKTQIEKYERDAKEFSAKFEKLQKVVEEQKTRMQTSEIALKNAEKKIKRFQEEASLKHEELMKVHNAWLPKWLQDNLSKYQALTLTYWEKHGRPAVLLVSKKASEHAAIAYSWAKPHLETVINKWAPALKQQWQETMVVVKPHVEKTHSKVRERFDKSVKPQLQKAYETVNPHIQTLKDKCSPYVDQIVVASQPHIEKVKTVLEPYTKHITRIYRRALTAAAERHHKLQKALMQKLKSNEFTEHIAHEDLVWFLASAVLAFPFYFAVKLYLVLLSNSKTATKSNRNSHAGHGHKKHKRRHVDK